MEQAYVVFEPINHVMTVIEAGKLSYPRAVHHFPMDGRILRR